ncbi:MAG: hypothetical protein K8S97_01460, partial [Anaerolineae bacterium]|nr:hypothetical protein [Anaerolineae bacterium]
MTFDADHLPPDHDDDVDEYDYDAEDYDADDHVYDDAPSDDDVPRHHAPEVVPVTSPPPAPPPHKLTDSGRIRPQVPISPQFAGEQGLPYRSWFLDMLGIEDPIVLGLIVLAAPLVILALLLPPFTVIDILDEQV